jgi:hypothetical protein
MFSKTNFYLIMKRTALIFQCFYFFIVLFIFEKGKQLQYSNHAKFLLKMNKLQTFDKKIS